MKRTLRTWPGLLLSLAFVAPLTAQNPKAAGSPAAMSIVAENLTAREAAQAGRPRVGAEADKVLAGDVVEYRLSFVNTTSAPVKNVVLEDPLPKGLVYVLGSALSQHEGVVAEYSTDGGRSYSSRPMVRVMENGQEVTRPAPAAAYTNIRWRVTGAVSPGAKVTASFRAQLGPGTPQ